MYRPRGRWSALRKADSVDDALTRLQRALRASSSAKLSVVADKVFGDLRPDTAERLEGVVVEAKGIAQRAYDHTRRSPLPIHVLGIVVAALMKEVAEDALFSEVRGDVTKMANVIGSATLGDVLAGEDDG